MFRLRHIRFWCTSCQFECISVRFKIIRRNIGYCMRCDGWRPVEMTTDV
jgi:hypothetical protein